MPSFRSGAGAGAAVVAQGTWGPSLGLQTLFPLRPEDGRAAAAAATSVTPPLALLALALAPEQP